MASSDWAPDLNLQSSEWLSDWIPVHDNGQFIKGS